MMSRFNQKGFTLIEVVLAMAVGAAIFAGVFIAYKNVGPNKRDAQRRSDLSKISQQVQTFSVDNNGRYPSPETTVTGLSLNSDYGGSYTKFLNYVARLNLKDPKTRTTYAASNFTTITNTTSRRSLTAGTWFYYPGISCRELLSYSSTSPPITKSTKYAVYMKLEKGETCIGSDS